MTLKRVYGLLEVKAVAKEGEFVVISGIATTGDQDRMSDIVAPLGATFAKEIPLLWQHMSDKPVGIAELGKATKNGIPFTARLPIIKEPGTLKDRIDEAIQSLRYRLIGAVSIGFRVINDAMERMKEGGYLFLETEILELSICSIPANPMAVITGVKSIDTQLRAASGKPQPSVTSNPGVSGTTKQSALSRLSNSRGKSMKSATELRGFRETKAARLAELATLFKTDGHEPSDEETSEFDELTSEVKQLDQDIRLQSYAEMTAKPVEGRTQKSGTESRGGMGFVRKTDPDDKFKGQSFTRVMIAKAVAMVHGNHHAMEMANDRWVKSHPKLVEFIKATVAGGGTGSGEWGAELAQSDNRFTGDFIEFLYGLTVFDRLGLREIPGRVNVKGQDGAFTGYWVGESKSIPMSKGDYSSVELTPLKVAGLTVLSMELLEDSQPSAEMLVRDGLAQASSQRVDTTFLSAAAASAGVSPAGILNGVTAIQSSGTDLAAVRADMQALIAPFIANKMGSGITFVMNPATALALSWMYGSLDQRAFPDINQGGGTLNGMSVLVGDNVTSGQIIAIRPQDVWRIGDTGVRISMSTEATIEQRDDPTGATDTPTGMNVTGMTNMFQEESVAFKVVRRINFQKRRSTAVQYVDNIEYGGIIS